MTMRFMVLRKADQETEMGTMPGPELIEAMTRYNESMLKAGVMLAGDGLRPSSQGTRVKMTGPKFTVTDGPFTETKELLAGFSIIQVGSKADAVSWLERWPAQDGHGHVALELRQLYEMSDFPQDAAEKEDGWRAEEQKFRDATEPAGAPQAPPPRKPGTTRYIVMLRSDATTESGKMPGEKTLAEMGALMGELAQSGALLGGEGLKPSAQGARVEFRNGKPRVTDGPFAESKEMIAGYTLIQVATKAEAVEFAKRWLAIHAGVGVQEAQIEIRPLFEAEDFAV
jgi:hypothetical protein